MVVCIKRQLFGKKIYAKSDSFDLKIKTNKEAICYFSSGIDIGMTPSFSQVSDGNKEIFDSLDSLDEIFRLTNHIEGAWWENSEVTWLKERSRSTSVGDVIVKEGGITYLCKRKGWKVIALKEEVEEVVKEEGRKRGTLRMKDYDVTIQRIEFREHTFRVHAESFEAADVAAAEFSSDYDWRDSSIDYAKEETTSVDAVS